MSTTTVRQTIHTFVSYSHDDAEIVADLLRRLQLRLGRAKGFEFESWDDRRILAGERWREEIEAAMERSDLGLLFVSWSFSGSSFIVREELPRLLDSSGGRRPIPVWLSRVRFDEAVDLHGLEECQFFRGADGSFYDELDPGGRNLFVDSLVRRDLEGLPEVLLRGEVWRWRSDHGNGGSTWRRRGSSPCFSSLCAPHYFALLGEYGIGKTTTCQALTLRIDEARKETDLPPAIYLDLRHLGDAAKPEPELETILDTVHNLPELAERPYTLMLIAEQIAGIEAARMRGEKVTGVTLNRHMVASWLERDTGKHQWRPEHKRLLMEELAAMLWREGLRSWQVDLLEQWLMGFLAASPEIAAHYHGKDRELLKEDFRTATFLVRPGEDSFRFAHSSLQEYFLASYLFRALEERRFDAWRMATPSVETLDFLGQLLEEAATRDALAGLEEILRSYRPEVSELALRYALRARERGYPVPSLARLDMAGADLRDLRFVGPEDGPRWNLIGASFRRCRLDRTVFERVDLETADFSGATLHRTEFFEARAPGFDVTGAELSGTLFRRTDLRGVDLDRGRPYRTQILACSGISEDGEPFTRVLGFEGDLGKIGAPSVPKKLEIDTGHTDEVRSCGFSPDGHRIVSAGDDRTVRV